MENAGGEGPLVFFRTTSGPAFGNRLLYAGADRTKTHGIEISTLREARYTECGYKFQ